jgi:hypothetical protein
LTVKGGQSGLLMHIRDDGKRFVVRADEKLMVFLELESAIRAVSVKLSVLRNRS